MGFFTIFGLAYLGTTLASEGILQLILKKERDLFKKEGLEYSSNSLMERFKNVFPVAMLLLIPVANIPIALYAVTQFNDIYTNDRKVFLVKGILQKKNNEQIEDVRTTDEKIKTSEERKYNKDNNSYQNKISNELSYSDMTPQERLAVLERERNSLLRQIEKENNNGKDPVKKIGIRK